MSSGADAWTKIRAGATLVQLYTGLVYGGLDLVDAMERTIVTELARGGHVSIAAAVGGEAERLAI